MSISIAELGMVIFSADGFRFGAEINQIVSIITSPEKLEGIDDSVPFVDLPAQLGTAETTLCNTLSTERPSKNNGKYTALLVDTVKGIKGVYVESVSGVVNIPLEQIAPLPVFLKNKMQIDCIWGIGKLEDELIILLDLERYLASSTQMIVQAINIRWGNSS